MLNCTVNSGTAFTIGIVNPELQVLTGAVNTGAGGKMTTNTLLLSPQIPVPGVLAGVLPQAVDVTYLATME